MLKKGDKNYGKPVEGSKTEARGRLAHQRVLNEIVELCSVIEDNGFKVENNRTGIKFGRLFEIYTVIRDGND